MSANAASGVKLSERQRQTPPAAAVACIVDEGLDSDRQRLNRGSVASSLNLFCSFNEIKKQTQNKSTLCVFALPEF